MFNEILAVAVLLIVPFFFLWGFRSGIRYRADPKTEATKPIVKVKRTSKVYHDDRVDKLDHNINCYCGDERGQIKV